MKLWLAILIPIILLVVLFIIFLDAPFSNIQEVKTCKVFDLGYEVYLEDNLIYDKCIIIEDGEELTIRQHLKKHRFDGLDVKGSRGEGK